LNGSTKKEIDIEGRPRSCRYMLLRRKLAGCYRNAIRLILMLLLFPQRITMVMDVAFADMATMSLF
jgi:hypothetical protein